MRYDTNFIWAFVVPTILISLVSYVSVSHNHSSKVWTLEMGCYHSELSVQLLNIRKKLIELLHERIIHSTTYNLARDCMGCTELYIENKFST